MSTKVCTKCKLDRPLEDFYLKDKKKNRRHSYCKYCNREYGQKHYRENIEKYRRKARIRNKKRYQIVRKFLWDYLKAHPCNCGEADPVALDFDHINKKEGKDKAVSLLTVNGNLQEIKDEIAKCVVRCANCHRKKTAKELGWYKEFYESAVD